MCSFRNHAADRASKLKEATAVSTSGIRQKAEPPADMADKVRGILAGMQALGFDVDGIQKDAGIAPFHLNVIGGRLPPLSAARIWREAFRRAPREELPTEVGLAVPYGAFGPLDLLMAASKDVATGFRTLAEHFDQVTSDNCLELQLNSTGVKVWLVRRHGNSVTQRECQIADEFAIAVIVNRFRTGIPLSFTIDAVHLTRPTPVHRTRHQALFGAPVHFASRRAGLHVPYTSWTAAIPTANPLVEETIRQLAPRMFLKAKSQDLELVIRSRLRVLLVRGSSNAASVSSSLGMSERTLHRRLRRLGLCYQDVLDRFRRDEAEQLLTSGRVKLSDVAFRLGYSSQSAFTRAFTRWNGASPKR